MKKISFYNPLWGMGRLEKGLLVALVGTFIATGFALVVMGVVNTPKTTPTPVCKLASGGFGATLAGCPEPPRERPVIRRVEKPERKPEFAPYRPDKRAGAKRSPLPSFTLGMGVGLGLFVVLSLVAGFIAVRYALGRIPARYESTAKMPPIESPGLFGGKVDTSMKFRAQGPAGPLSRMYPKGTVKRYRIGPNLFLMPAADAEPAWRTARQFLLLGLAVGAVATIALFLFFG